MPTEHEGGGEEPRPQPAAPRLTVAAHRAKEYFDESKLVTTDHSTLHWSPVLCVGEAENQFILHLSVQMFLIDRYLKLPTTCVIWSVQCIYKIICA